MSNLLQGKVRPVHDRTVRLSSFRAAGNPGFRFDCGMFTTFGLTVGSGRVKPRLVQAK